MKVRVLGSYGGRFPGRETTSFLIGERLLIDAGTGVWKLSLDEQRQIDDVLLTHAHLDHVVDLPFLVDNVFPYRSTPVRVWGPAQVLDGVRRHLFNDVLWPDFSRLPSEEAPAVVFHPLPPGEDARVAGWRVTWARSNHPVFTAGYLLEKEGYGLLFSGDTGPTAELWRLGQSCPRLRTAFVEVSFPDRLRDLAVASGHLTPALLAGELTKLGVPDLPVKVFHMKPRFLQEVLQDLETLADSRLQVLHGGEEFRWSR